MTIEEKARNDLFEEWRDASLLLKAQTGIQTVETFKLLESVYDSNRYYHNFNHVIAVMEKFGEIRGNSSVEDFPAKDGAEAVAAVMLHDSFYDTKIRDSSNVVISCQIARSMGFGDRVVQMICATEHKNVDYEGKGEISVDAVHDADLALFADDYQQVWNDCLNVRQEWSHVPLKAFISGRVEIIRKFINRSRIFNTEYGQDVWEERARKNMKKEIDDLREGKLRL